MSARYSFRRANLIPLPISVAVLLLLWQAAVSGLDLPRIVLPGPLDVVAALGRFGGYIWLNVGVTVAGALGGFALGSGLAVGGACVFVQSDFSRRALYPLALALKSTPLVVLAPLLVLWLGSGVATKVMMSALLAFFPVLVATYDGLRATDESYVDLLRMHGAGRWDILWQVRLPFALPPLFSGLRVAMPLAMVGAILAEYTGAASGIGTVIATASGHLETAVVFGSILSVSAASLVLFGLVCLLERQCLFWKRTDRTNP